MSLDDDDDEPPTSAGSLGSSQVRPFGPEQRGGFRDRKPVTVRHVEIARKLAVSETFQPLEEMRHRLEALVMLDDETRHRHKILDAEYAKAMEIYSIIIAFQSKKEIPNGGFKFISVPFTQRTTEEIQRGFEDWLDGPQGMYILDNKDNMTEETASALETRFVAKMLPWVLRLTVRVSDAIMLDEFDAAAGKITLKRNVG